MGFWQRCCPDVHVTVDAGGVDVAAMLARIEHNLDTLIAQETQQMADLTALAAEVAENTEVVASATALLSQLAQEIRDNATDPAALEALAASLDSNNAALAAAIVENTPAADPPVDPPA